MSKLGRYNLHSPSHAVFIPIRFLDEACSLLHNKFRASKICNTYIKYLYSINIHLSVVQLLKLERMMVESCLDLWHVIWLLH